MRGLSSGVRMHVGPQAYDNMRGVAVGGRPDVNADKEVEVFEQR
jgi:hypothetical protein